MKIRLIQMNPRPKDKQYNLNKIHEYIDKDSDSKIDLIAFPELALSGYLTDSKLYEQVAEPIPGPSTEAIIQKAQDRNIYIVLGMPEKKDRFTYNSAALFGPKGLIGVTRKRCLPNFISQRGVKYEEKKYFTAGTEITTFETNIGKIGIEICYELWYPEITRIHALQGAMFILNISAAPVGVPELFQLLAKARALENTAYFAYVNQVDAQGELSMGGGSCIVDYLSNVKVQASIGEQAKEEVLECDIDMDSVLEHRTHLPILGDVRPEILKKLYEIAVDL